MRIGRAPRTLIGGFARRKR